jgi:hypothetical protein
MTPRPEAPPRKGGSRVLNPAANKFRLKTTDLFDNPVGYRGLSSDTSLPKNVDFIKKFTFFVVFKRLLANLGSAETEVSEQL